MRNIKSFENFNNIEIVKSGGINCDNPECGWNDQTVETSQYSEWVGRPCPECGENLLTQEDFDKVSSVLAAVNVVNSIDLSDFDKIAKNLDPDDIIDAYNKLKELGLRSLDDGQGTFEM